VKLIEMGNGKMGEMSKNHQKSGERGQKMCKHGAKWVKHIDDMAICAKAHQYLVNMAKEGQIMTIQCELCIIKWLCDDCEHNGQCPYKRA
jgi:hypothetical protein